MKKYKLYTMGMLMMATLLSTASCTSTEDASNNSKPTIDPVEPITDYVLTNYDIFVKPLYNEVSAISKNKESRILYPIQIGIIASVLRPDEPNLPIQIDNQLRNYR